jgi:hypothetical protein
MIDHTGRNLYLILIPNSVTDQNDLTQIKLLVYITKRWWNSNYFVAGKECVYIHNACSVLRMAKQEWLCKNMHSIQFLSEL